MVPRLLHLRVGEMSVNLHHTTEQPTLSKYLTSFSKRFKSVDIFSYTTNTNAHHGKFKTSHESHLTIELPPRVLYTTVGLHFHRTSTSLCEDGCDIWLGLRIGRDTMCSPLET